MRKRCSSCCGVNRKTKRKGDVSSHGYSLLWVITAVGHAQQPVSSEPVQIADPVKFDEWGDIRFSDEKARLDNAAINLQRSMPRNIIYLVVYAGQTSCVGEAKARGVRAKKHLVSRGIPTDQVVWIDGGYQSEVATRYGYGRPRWEGAPFIPRLNSNPAN